MIVARPGRIGYRVNPESGFTRMLVSGLLRTVGSKSTFGGRAVETMQRNPGSASGPVAETTSTAGLKRWGWGAFVVATVVTAVIGLFFAASMNPTSGPYAVDERYPFGSALRTWQVTVGFDWVAYAIVFGAAGSVAHRAGSRPLWIATGVSLVILWFPHVAIGIAFLMSGS